MLVVQKDLIQKDKEMAQDKCERQYEWSSALGKFLDLCTCLLFFFFFFFWHAWLLSIPSSYHWLSTTPNSKVIFCSPNQTQSETSKSWSIETKPLFYFCFCLSRFYVSYSLFTIPEIQSSRAQFQLSDSELLIKKLHFLSLKQSLFSA